MSSTKQIVEQTTGVTKAKSLLKDIDAIGKLAIESYPCYAPMGGVTFRVDRSGDQPALWLDASVDDARAIAADILNTLAELEKANLPEDPDLTEVKKQYPTYVARKWSVGKWMEGTDDVSLKDKTPVFNNKDNTLVWFETLDAAREIVEHVNGR